MTGAEILAFINRNQFCFLATTEAGEPRVRGMAFYRANENGIVFHTGTTKDLYRQILANPAVEICFFSPQENIQVRVRGTAGILDDGELKREIVENRPWMKPWIEANGYDWLGVFRVSGCIASAWTFATNLEPKTWVKL